MLCPHGSTASACVFVEAEGTQDPMELSLRGTVISHSRESLYVDRRCIANNPIFSLKLLGARNLNDQRHQCTLLRNRYPTLNSFIFYFLNFYSTYIFFSVQESSLEKCKVGIF